MAGDGASRARAVAPDIESVGQGGDVGTGDAADVVRDRRPTPRPRADALPPAPRSAGLALAFSLAGLATVSFNATRVAGWTLSDLLFFASGFVVGVKLLSNDERGLTPAPYRHGSRILVAGTLIVLTGATVSGFGSWSPLASMMVVARLAWTTFIWFWILRSVCPDRRALFSMVNAVRVTIVVSAVLAVLGTTGILQVNSENFGSSRQAALTFHPGELMNFLIVGWFLVAVPALVPSTRSRHRHARLGWMAAVAIVSWAIFTTGSTSSLVAVGVAVVVVGAVVLYTGPPRLGTLASGPLVPMFIVAGAVAGAFVLFTSDLPIVERLTDNSSGLDDSLEARERANDAIFNNFDSYLLVGIGPFFVEGANDTLATSQFASNGAQHNGVHNMHLKMLYEAGLPALVGLWIVIFAAGRQAVKLVSATRDTDLYPVSLALLGGFVAANTSAMFGPTVYARHYWLPYALIGCLWVVRRRELARRSIPGLPAAPRQSGARALPAVPGGK
jgi:hypothetical protein